MNSNSRRPSYKINKIENEILNILNHTLKFVIYDDMLREVSFTYVKVDPGLSTAVISVDTFKRDEITKVVAKLNQCKSVFKREVAKYMQTRRIPDIIFQNDVTIDRVLSVERALKNDVVIKRKIKK
jgi:ribosome-binding factor A